MFERGFTFLDLLRQVGYVVHQLLILHLRSFNQFIQLRNLNFSICQLDLCLAVVQFLIR